MGVRIYIITKMATGRVFVDLNVFGGSVFASISQKFDGKLARQFSMEFRCEFGCRGAEGAGPARKELHPFSGCFSNQISYAMRQSYGLSRRIGSTAFGPRPPFGFPSTPRPSLSAPRPPYWPPYRPPYRTLGHPIGPPLGPSASLSAPRPSAPDENDGI